jgi:SAM-dependent methyltransferase
MGNAAMLTPDKNQIESRVIMDLVRKFGLLRVNEMMKLYKSQGDPNIDLDTYLKVALDNGFKPVQALKLQKCPLCASAVSRTVGSYVYYSHFINLRKCTDCELGYADTQLDRGVVSSHFEAAYKEEEYFLRARLKSYQQVLETVKEFYSKGKLLDVGCAKGHFLRMVLNAGFDAVGCDISLEAQKFCSEAGLKVHQGEVRDLAYPDGSFDLITCLDTLYYSQGLQEDIRKMVSLLNSGGVLILRGPNRRLDWYHNLGRMLVSLGIRPRYRNLLFFNPEHVYVFDKVFFEETLKRFGLDCVSIQAGCPGPDLFKAPIANILFRLSRIRIAAVRFPIVSNSLIVVLKKR